MAFVCLMTIGIFTSCSENDDRININSINGKWLTTDNIVWNFRGGSLSIYPKDYVDNAVKYSYEVENSTIIIHMNVEIGDADASYYKRKIDDLQEQLKTSRGSYRQYLIDEINKLREEYIRAKKNQRKEKVDAYGTILQLDSKTLVIQFNKNNMIFRKM